MGDSLCIMDSRKELMALVERLEWTTTGRSEFASAGHNNISIQLKQVQRPLTIAVEPPSSTYHEEARRLDGEQLFPMTICRTGAPYDEWDFGMDTTRLGSCRLASGLLCVTPLAALTSIPETALREGVIFKAPDAPLIVEKSGLRWGAYHLDMRWETAQITFP